jgi:hypothetical protein
MQISLPRAAAIAAAWAAAAQAKAHFVEQRRAGILEQNKGSQLSLGAGLDLSLLINFGVRGATCQLPMPCCVHLCKKHVLSGCFDYWCVLCRL